MTYMNLTLLTDFYELTMSQGYHNINLDKKIVVFDLFYRANPSKAAILSVLVYSKL